MSAPATTSGSSARAQLEAWREQHADRLDPFGFGLIEAFERRIASHQGSARRLLEDRLATLVAAYADKVAQAMPVAAAPVTGTGALAALVDYATGLARTTTTDPRTDFTVLAALDDFRDLWSELHMRRQLRQSLAPATTAAGPLNSGRLVHRALMLMRTLSPDYLQHFLTYIDLLAWMQQLNDATAPRARSTPAANPAKRPRNRRPK